MPEVIYSAGKPPEQVAEIFLRMAERGVNVLATRADTAKSEAVKARVGQAEFYPQSRCIVLRESREGEWSRGQRENDGPCYGSRDAMWIKSQGSCEAWWSKIKLRQARFCRCPG